MTDRGNKAYLLDTSAAITLIEDEPGAERVEDLLRAERVVVPFVVGLEVYYITRRERTPDEADRRLALIRRLPAIWVDRVSEAVLVTAGNLKSRHRLSLADALVAAFAIDAGAILVHKDPEYEKLGSVVEQGRLPSKAAE
ncbi:MAG: PIN domain-containing protein [Chloroflexota bacterium]